MKSLDDHVYEQFFNAFAEQIEWMEKCGNGTISVEAYMLTYMKHGVDPHEAARIFEADLDALEHYWRQLDETKEQ